jgi:hypothetical protein
VPYRVAQGFDLDIDRPARVDQRKVLVNADLGVGHLLIDRVPGSACA